MKQTVGDVSLCEEGSTSARRYHGDGTRTYKIGRGTEVYGVCIAFVPFFEKRCEGASWENGLNPLIWILYAIKVRLPRTEF